jgi:hypothetical protein
VRNAFTSELTAFFSPFLLFVCGKGWKLVFAHTTHPSLTTYTPYLSNLTGQSRLREIFLKTDNVISGSYLAEITKEVSALSVDCLSGVERVCLAFV